MAILSSCKNDEIPPVTLHGIDLRNDKVTPREITKYNKETCRLEGNKHPTQDLHEVNPKTGFPILHGGTCFTKEDAAKLLTAWQTRCEQERNRK